MSDDSTDRLVSFLESQPEYVMAFMAEVGGDPSDYIGTVTGEVDFEQVTPTQIGEALRQFMVLVPPTPEVPPDLDVVDVDWAAMGSRIEQILEASFGGM